MFNVSRRRMCCHVQHCRDNCCRELECGLWGDMIEVCNEDNQEEVDHMESKFRYEIAHKRWAVNYNHEGAQKFKSAMMIL